MANSFSASFVEVWAKEQQRIFDKINVAKKISDMSFQSQLRKGDTLNRPYRSTDGVQTYTPGTGITIDSKTDTNEAMTIDDMYATGFYVDDFEAIQNNYNAAANYGRDNGVLLSNQIDADILGEVANATTTIDDEDLGGTAGNGITLTTANVLATVSAAKKELAKLDVPLENLFGVISPDFEEILIQYGAGRDTSLGDQFQNNGFIRNFYGFDLYRSNQLYNTAVLYMATDPTDTNTVVINGVTFMADAAIAAVAGSFLMGGGADTSRENLTNLINNPGTTDANQVALSASDQRKIANCTATNDNATDMMTITYKGLGTLAVSETLANAADIWTAATRLQHQMFGVKGSPTLVIQRDTKPEIKTVSDKLGRNILNGVLYGKKTFIDQTKMLVDVALDAHTF